MEITRIDAARIFHLVTNQDLRSSLTSSSYRPATLDDLGFVHCAEEQSVLSVANDYFSEAADPVLLLAIDVRRLSSEVRYEAAAPIAGGGTAHVASAVTFPHVYGPLDTQAITRLGVLGRTATGFCWPTEMITLDEYVRLCVEK
ncbi:MAG TPA: DUF952 domain-containing protein [Gemmatimonadaceae bacterium]